jgi:hypothetical protein
MIISIDTKHLEVLTAEEAILAQVIHFYQARQGEGKIQLDRKFLAELVGFHTNSIPKLLDNLKALGFLDVSEHYVRTTDGYLDFILGEDGGAAVEAHERRCGRKKRTDNRMGMPEEGYKIWIDMWNKAYGTNLKVTEGKKKQIRGRRQKFSAEEIRAALRKRHNDEWMNGDGKKYKSNWASFWRNDEKVEHYLNKKQVKSHNAGSYITGTVN